MVRGVKSRRGRPSSTGSRYRRRLLLEPLCDRRVLAAITGVVFDDVNDSARRDAEEGGLQERLVFLDSNADGQLSEGEPYRLTDDDGRFAFEDLGVGDYSVRLYDGTSSQRQTIPVEPEWGERIELEEAVISAVSLDQSQLYLLRDDSLVRSNLVTGESTSLELPATIASIHPLPDGRVVALGEADAGRTSDAAWLISFADERIEAVDFGLAEGETGWSSMAVDGTGNGILLAAHGEGEPTIIRQLRWSDGTIQAIESTHSVVAGATTLSHPDAVTSLIAVPQSDSLSLTQWSNATGTPVVEASTEVAGGVALLAFDEVAGLAIAEDSDGDLLVLDASANMALLHRFTDLEGPIELDGHRERLYAFDDAGNLVIQDLRNRETRQTVSVSEAAAGGIVLVEGGRAAILGHADHLRRIRLDKPVGHEVSIVEGKESADIFFGLYVDGANEAPAYEDEPFFDLDEGTVFNLAVPGLLNGAVDPDEGDQFLLLRSSDPSFGSILTSPAGGLRYQPEAGFKGIDSFDVRLHDGRSVSEVVTVELEVRPVDPQGPVYLGGPIVSEDIAPGAPLGTIILVNPDIDDFIKIEVANDDRFFVDGDRLILAEGAQLDYESEPTVDVDLYLYDRESGEQEFATVLLQVSDAPEAITGIHLESLETIAEGIYTESSDSAGWQVATVRVEDLDEGGRYDFEVSDSRFEVVDASQDGYPYNGYLQIVAGSEFDFEQEPVIEFTIHASDLEGPFDFTESFTVTIEDVNELPTTASFSSDNIVERVAGATVGDVDVDDPDQPSTVRFSVDDSRFEFEGPTLKLRDGVFVERSRQEEILLTLTVADYAEEEFVHFIQVKLEVLPNESPFHNDDLSTDVNGDGEVDPLDALAIINYLNRHGPGPIEEAINSGNAERFYDVNDDGLVTPLDALLVINYLNREASGAVSTVGGESDSELTPPAMVPEGENPDSKRAEISLADPASLTDDREPGTLPLSPAPATSPPARTNDLAVEALTKDADSVVDANRIAADDWV